MTEFRFPPLKVPAIRLPNRHCSNNASCECSQKSINERRGALSLPSLDGDGDSDARNGGRPQEPNVSSSDDDDTRGGDVIIPGGAKTEFSHSVGEIGLATVPGPEPGMVAMAIHAPNYEARRVNNIRRLTNSRALFNGKISLRSADQALEQMIAAVHKQIPGNTHRAKSLADRPSTPVPVLGTHVSTTTNWDCLLPPDYGADTWNTGWCTDQTPDRVRHCGVKKGWHQRTSTFKGSTCRSILAACFGSGKAKHEVYYWPHGVAYDWTFWTRQSVSPGFQGNIWIEWQLNYYFRVTGARRDTSWYHYMVEFRND